MTRRASGRPQVVLASASPRRLQLLGPLALDITVDPADIDETEHPQEEPARYVQRLAATKAATVASRAPGRLVIGADTTVDLDGAILGKPAGPAEATAMLRSLSGRDHLVHTGVSVRIDASVVTAVATTTVRFIPMSDDAIAWYVGTGEPFDKAGAYALQGAGGAFVAAINGSVSNVVGLPLTLVIELAAELGVPLIRAEPPQRPPHRAVRP